MLEGVHELKIFVVALVAKLVARETKDSELVAVLLRQGIQLNEIPDGRTSHGRDIVNEDNLALELREVELLAVNRGAASPASEGLPLEVVKRRLGADRGALRVEPKIQYRIDRVSLKIQVAAFARFGARYCTTSCDLRWRRA